MYFSYLVSTRIEDGQKEWALAVERRVSGTLDCLQSMTGIKMSGLADALASSLRSLLKAEISLATAWRKLFAVVIALGM